MQAMTDRELMQQALEALENGKPDYLWARSASRADERHMAAITALRERLARPDPLLPPPECQTEAEKTAYAFGWWKALETQRLARQEQEPVPWMPIESLKPQAKALDILMSDGSILRAVLPQFDGDLWWEGAGTGEKFIDPKYANVTHWRIHSDTAPPAREWQGLTEEDIDEAHDATLSIDDFARAIEAKLREKNA